MRRWLLLPLLAAPACYRWTPAPGAAARTVEHDRPSEVRLTRRDGSSVTLRAPRVVTDTAAALGTSGAEPDASDTLVAGRLVSRTLAGGEVARGGGARDATVVVRTSEIRSVEVRHLSAWRTAAAVAALAGGVAASLVAFAR